MKKLVFMFVAVAAISFASCGNKAQQAPVDTDSEMEAVGRESSGLFLSLTPTLSQIHPPVATTPTIIWSISWNQSGIPVSLHQKSSLVIV